MTKLFSGKLAHRAEVRCVAIFVSVFVAASMAMAQGADTAKRTPAHPSAVASANSAFKAASIAIERGDTTAAIASLVRAIEADPNFYDAHDRYYHLMVAKIFNSDDDLSSKRTALRHALESQYSAWSKRFPNSAGVAYGTGSFYTSSENPAAKQYLLRAVQLDPRLTRAYEMLSSDAERWGDQAAAREYMHRAAVTEPGNPNYAFYDAMNVLDVDPVKGRQVIQDLIRRFPSSDRGAQALYWLATRSRDTAEKRAAYEQLKAAYPPAKFSWSASGMSGLYDFYVTSVPEKALALAQEMMRESTGRDQRDWSAQVVLAQNVILAQKLSNQHMPQAALGVLSSTQLSRYSGLTDAFVLWKAVANDATGATQTAYDSVVARYATNPTDELHNALVRYAAKLQKDSTEITADVWVLRDKAATVAPSFKLVRYPNTDSTALADYRGKVVLLTYWFPGCGPCRGEFPHFQAVMDKFKNNPAVAYVGINVLRDQDDYVQPFMRGTGYSFTPLGSDGQIEKTYKVRGEPTNFLIDQNGRIIFSNFRTDEHNQRTLELMINEMLARPTTGVSASN